MLYLAEWFRHLLIIDTLSLACMSLQSFFRIITCRKCEDCHFERARFIGPAMRDKLTNYRTPASSTFGHEHESNANDYRQHDTTSTTSTTSYSRPRVRQPIYRLWWTWILCSSCSLYRNQSSIQHITETASIHLLYVSWWDTFGVLSRALRELQIHGVRYPFEQIRVGEAGKRKQHSTLCGNLTQHVRYLGTTARWGYSTFNRWMKQLTTASWNNSHICIQPVPPPKSDTALWCSIFTAWISTLQWMRNNFASHEKVIPLKHSAANYQKCEQLSQHIRNIERSTAKNVWFLSSSFELPSSRHSETCYFCWAG